MIPLVRTMSHVNSMDKANDREYTDYKEAVADAKKSNTQTSQGPQREKYTQNFIQPIHQVCS